MMNDILIPILSFVAVTAIGAAVVIARQARRQQVRARLEEFGQLTLADGPGGEHPTTTSATLKFLETIGQAASTKAADKNLTTSLAHAGYHSPSAATIYTGLRLICLTLGVVIAASILLPMHLMWPAKLMIVLGGGFIASLVPSIYVDVKRSARKTEVQHYLPDAVDLLEICVSSGMGLDMAWNAVSDEIRRVSTILADEMALTNLEIHLGADRASALRHMAQRTGSDDLNSLVGTLVQSERFGTPISDALRVFAESMREERHTRASESAEKLGIKMLFPMIAFILPAILIVMGGGAVIKIINMFNMM